MTLDQLKSLQAIVEGGSLRAASQSLNRTPPTISVAIKNLEDELGLQIFDRDQYRNTLTHQGKKLYEKAKLVLAQAQSFKHLATQLAAGEETEVGIAFTSAIAVAPIIRTIRQCKEEYPGTRLEVYSENGMGPMDLLESGQASIVIIPWIQNNDKLESIHFMNIRFKCVIAANSPLLKEYEVIPRAVMKNCPQVIISSGQPSSRSFAVLEGGDQWRVNDFHTKKEIIMQGMGWGNLPEHLIEEEIKQGLLVPIKVEGDPEKPTIELRVVRKEGEPVGPVAQKLWGLFEEQNKEAAK